jgi:hypothetical protein
MEIPTLLLDKFKGTAPIFPLPDFAMFPKVGKAFKIFEPRYVEMVKDVLSGDKLMCVTQLKPGWKEDYEGNPEIHETGTLNFIFKHENIKDDEFMIYTFALKKVQILELEKTHVYRKGKLTIMEDNKLISGEVEKRERLIRKFASIADISLNTEELDFFQNPLISMDMMVNTICHTLPIAPQDKQSLLELPDLSLRLDVVSQYMDSQAKAFNQESGLIDFLPIDSNWN